MRVVVIICVLDYSMHLCLFVYHVGHPITFRLTLLSFSVRNDTYVYIATVTDRTDNMKFYL